MDEKLFKAYELYLLERTRLTTAKQEASKSYDRTILTFSGGAIALSITFLEKIAPQPDAKGLLYTSWSLLAVAMMSTLYSLLATQRACEQEISDLEKRYEDIVGVSNEEETTVPPASELTIFGVSWRWLRAFAAMFRDRVVSFADVVAWLNRLAGVFFFAGVLFFAWFALENWVNAKPEVKDVSRRQQLEQPARRQAAPAKRP